MYLSEEKRAEIRKCIGKNHSNLSLNSERNSGKNKKDHTQGFHYTTGGRKVSQILFQARDVKQR